MLLFVEDPGAVNCFAPLAQELAARGEAFTLVSASPATALLADRGIVSKQIEDLEDIVGASAVIVGTSENRQTKAFDLISTARAQGIPSAAIIDSPANSEHRFRGLTDQALAHAPDWILCPDAPTADSYVKLGMNPERTLVVGHPNDDRVAVLLGKLAATDRDSMRRELFDVGSGHRVIVFVSEISDGLDGAAYSRTPDYTLDGRGERNLRTEVVVEELLDAVASLGPDFPKIHMVLRRHPKETDADLLGLADEFDQVSRGGDIHALIWAADLAVGMSSMLLKEAALLGTPSLAILPRRIECGWLAPVRDGEIEAVFDRDTLRSRLRQIVPDSGNRAEVPNSEASLPRVLAAIGNIVKTGR